MGRRRPKSLIAILFLSGAFLTVGTVYGQPHAGAVRRTPTLKTMPERWHSLSPEDRLIFRRNAERWMQMGPEQRTFLRQQEKLRQARLIQEADAALRDAGLRLDQQRRELFQQRYFQERRTIERELLQETEAKRKQKLPALNERLKHEFEQTNAGGTSTLSPTSSVTPKRQRD